MYIYNQGCIKLNIPSSLGWKYQVGWGRRIREGKREGKIYQFRFDFFF